MGYPTDDDFAEAHGWNKNRPSISEVLRADVSNKSTQSQSTGESAQTIIEKLIKEKEELAKACDDLFDRLSQAATMLECGGKPEQLLVSKEIRKWLQNNPLESSRVTPAETANSKEHLLTTSTKPLGDGPITLLGVKPWDQCETEGDAYRLGFRDATVAAEEARPMQGMTWDEEDKKAFNTAYDKGAAEAQLLFIKSMYPDVHLYKLEAPVALGGTTWAVLSSRADNARVLSSDRASVESALEEAAIDVGVIFKNRRVVQKKAHSKEDYDLGYFGGAYDFYQKLIAQFPRFRGPINKVFDDLVTTTTQNQEPQKKD